MMLLLISGVMAVVPLAGIAYLWYIDQSVTVGKMFMTLIALTISGLFGLNALIELRHMVKGDEGSGAAQGGGARGITSSAAAGSTALMMGALREQGTVEAVGYYESQIGRPNHSIITLSAGGGQRLVTLLGDLRDQFPVGKKVELVYRPDPQGYSLVQRRIFA